MRKLLSQSMTSQTFSRKSLIGSLVARSILSVALFSLLGLAPLSPAHAERHAKYKAFTVTDSILLNTFHGQGAINNLGEIVYLKETYVEGIGSVAQIYSTRRGQISFTPTNSAQYPDINDAGEIVYGDGSFGNGPRLVSNLRGDLGRGYLPRINAHGDVGFMDQEGVFIRYSNGTQVLLSPGGTHGNRPINLTADGELYFSTYETEFLVPQLYVATVNSVIKLTNFTAEASENFTTFAANDSGVYVYGRDYKLFAANGDVIWRGPIANVSDMNDFGDFVVTVGTPAVLPSGDNTTIFNIVLLTKRPHYYRNEFKRYRRRAK